MPRIPPLPEADATDKVEQTYQRIKEMLAAETVPEPFLVYGRVAPFLQDFYMNFKKFVYAEGKIDARTKAIIALAVSARDNCTHWTDFFMDRCRQLGLADEQLAEVLAVAATNAMYNTFFKIRDLSGTSLFEGMGVGLRAHTFGNTSLDERTVELVNLAISTINACKPCTTGHLEALVHQGLSHEAALEAVQCAATMIAGVAFLKSAGY